MLEFYFHVLKTYNLIQKKVKIGQLCPDVCGNCSLRLERWPSRKMAAILFLHGLRFFFKVYDLTKVHAKFHACIIKCMIFAVICWANRGIS